MKPSSKNPNVGNSRRTFKKLAFFILCLHFTVFNIAAQAPVADWLKSQWYDMPTVAQDNSGEDWHYGFAPYKEGGITVGYAGFGFSSIVNDNGLFNCVNCTEGLLRRDLLERPDYKKGCVYPHITEMDLLGNVEWYEIYTKGVGQFRAGIQLNDESGYVGVGDITFDGLNGVRYNPGLPGGVSELPECVTVGQHYALIYVARTDEEGNLVADACYGLGTVAEASTPGWKGEAYGIIEDAEDHNLVIVGYVFVNGSKKSYVMKLDKTTLNVLWSTTIIPTTNSTYESHATAVIEYNNYYYVAGTRDESAISPLHGKINIVKLDALGMLDKTFVINTANTGDTDIDVHLPQSPTMDYNISTCAAYDLAINNGDLLVAALVKRNDAIQGVETEAIAKVYRINLTGDDMIWENTAVVSNEPATHPLRSFDLKIGIANTIDGGYVVTSSKHDADLFLTGPGTYNLEYYPGNSYTFDYENTKVWNSDAYIAKFNASDNMMWNSVYPYIDNYGPYFPEDIKQMECVYHILEAPDGGYVVAGNNSMNFDDDLVLKVYSDCNLYQTFAETDIVATPSPYEIYTSEIWGSNKKVKGIVVVKSGGTLTINNNAVIQFTDSKASNVPTYIKVERGGRLILDQGAKLTGMAACNSMWEGVYVEGTNGTNHPSVASFMAANYTNTNHGFVWVKGNSTIENARCAIYSGKDQKPPLYLYGGGIVLCDNANFINNSKDIYFAPFNKTNISFIRNSRFKTTAALKDIAEYPLSHIEMVQTKNIQIRGNTFENTTVNANRGNRGTGISGNQAFFTVNDNPNGFGAAGATGSAPNTFNKLYYGVYATQYAVATSNIIADGNVFTDNHRSIYMGGTYFAETNRNSFTQGNGSDYGLYYDAGTGYGIEENTFTGPGAGLTKSPTALIVNNSGTDNNAVYRNTISGFKYATKTQGNNGNTSTGLEYKCNTFSSNKYDIALLSAAGVTATMKKSQGACGGIATPANNLFTDPSFANIGTQIVTSADINTANYYFYTFHRDISLLLTPFAGPGLYSNSIDPAELTDADEFGCNGTSFNTTDWPTLYCPTNFPTGGGGVGGRMAKPNTKGVRPTKSVMLDIMNPPGLAEAKAGSPAATAYNNYLDTIAFNMLVSYYMENNYQDSLAQLVAASDAAMAAGIEAEIAVDSAQYMDAQEIADDITATPTEGTISIELQQISITLAADSLTWQQLPGLYAETVYALATQNTQQGIQAQLVLELTDGKNYEEPIYALEDEVTEEELRTIQQAYPVADVNTITVYPHPVGNSSIAEIHLEFLSGNDRFVVTDLHGKIITQFPLEENISYVKLSNTLLPPGVYIGYVKCDGCSQKLSTQIVVVK